MLEPPGRFSALHLGRAVALPGAAVHPRLARREGPVQAGRARRRLGRAAAARADGHLHAAVQPDRRRADRRRPLPGLRLRRRSCPGRCSRAPPRARARSLVGNQNLVSKVYFPRLVIPAGRGADVGPRLRDQLGAAVRDHGHLRVRAAARRPCCCPLVLVAAMLAAFSVGVWLSALNVAYRDVQYVVPFLIQAWLFLTPVAYPTTSVPEHLDGSPGSTRCRGSSTSPRWALLGRRRLLGVVGALGRDHARPAGERPLLLPPSRALLRRCHLRSRSGPRTSASATASGPPRASAGTARCARTSPASPRHGAARQSGPTRDFWALKDVSFEVTRRRDAWASSGATAPARARC